MKRVEVPRGPSRIRARAGVALTALFGTAAVGLWLPQWAPSYVRAFPIGIQLDQAPDGDRGEDGWVSAALQIDRTYLGTVLFQDLIYRRYDRDRDRVRLFAGVGYRSQRLRSAFSPKTAMPRASAHKGIR